VDSIIEGKSQVPIHQQWHGFLFIYFTGMATGDRAVARRAKAGWLTLRKRLRCESAQFRLALPQMPRAEARGASL